MPACTMRPSDRRNQLQRVGNDLVRRYGKKRFYTVQEVKNANLRQGVAPDFSCWSHAFFNSHHDFDDYHASIGETCDYVSMKREMLDAVTSAGDASPSAGFNLDVDLSWLELPDIDWSIFDVLDL